MGQKVFLCRTDEPNCRNYALFSGLFLDKNERTLPADTDEILDKRMTLYGRDTGVESRRGYERD